jgi:hypothetical protein
MSALNNSALIGASGSTGYQISRSVRLRSSASAYFNRTQATPTDEKKFTISSWVKRGRLGVYQAVFGGRDNSTAQSPLVFNASDQLVWGDSDGVSTFYTGTSSAVFRDPSAWYHIITVYDSNNATAADRLIFYVNGVRQTITITGSGSSIPLSRAGYWNQSGTSILIGATNTATDFFDGYVTEINVIDGQALTPSSFGETNTTTGVWQPKRYTGTYGTNGFYLNFSDNTAATAAAIGADYSGNGNNWTPNNISVTAGATYDSMLDVPTLWADGGNGRGNYCTLNPLTSTNSITVNNGNLYSAASSASGNVIRSTLMNNIGKWYFEATVTFSSIGFAAIGVVLDSQSIVSPTGLASVPAGMWLWRNDAYKVNNGTATAYGTSASSGDIIMIAYDAGAGKIWFGRQGTWFASGDPAAGTNESFSGLTTSIGACVNFQGTIGSSTFDCNFGQRPFAYTPPTGFRALNTLNLPQPTILKGNQYFDATTYTGNGGTQSIVNSGGMQPDLVWIKNRSTTNWHQLYDSVRGVQKALYSNATDAEATETQGLLSFNTNGMTVGTNAGINGSGNSIVGWQWKEGATQGFDIVTYTGDGTSGRTLSHSLGVAPRMMIVKSRSTSDNWNVYHASIGATKWLQLNTTSAEINDGTSGTWNNTAPTSSVFTVNWPGLGGYTNQNGTTYVAYLFSEVAGFSAFGSYTGNGSADGPFVFCGFRPEFVMIKNATGTASANTGWYMFDTARNTFNVMANPLLAQVSDAEQSGYAIDFLSNGFKLRISDSGTNSSAGATHIYMAFAETPFKNALAR